MKKKNLIIGAIGVVLFFALSMLVIKATGNKHHRMMKHKMHMIKDLSAEQLASMQTKTMTLYLDLSASQQQSVKAINTDFAQSMKSQFKDWKEKGKKCSSEHRFEMMNGHLDKQIALKNQLKKVLSEEQMIQWIGLQTSKPMGLGKLMFFGFN